MQAVLFCTAWEVDGFLLNPGSDIRVGPFGENQLTLRFFKPGSEEAVVGISKSLPGEIFAKCIVQISQSAVDALKTVHDSLTPVPDESLISCATPSAEFRDQCQSDRQHAAGVVADILTKPPASLQTVNEDVSRITKDGAIYLLRMLRWRAVRDFHFQVRRRTSVYWMSHLDGHWRRVPSVPPAPSSGFGISVGISDWPQFVDEINQRLSNDSQPGTSFDLLCEARHLSNSRPHLALIEAVQSLEIGTKEAITRLCPAAGFLVENIPSPPVVQLLVDYIPTLIANTKAKDLYLDFMTKRKQEHLKKIVRQRNELTHKAERIAITGESAAFACDLVGDCLYKLELACGEFWAANAFWNRESLAAHFQLKTCTKITDST